MSGYIAIIMRINFTGSLVLLCFFFSARLLFAQPNSSPAAASVLSTGNWFKIALTETGIYKIDRNFLKAAGIAPENINPQHLKIYGNGGGMLPQPNRTPRPNDLTQNAIWVAGEADGKFDNADYILFYGQGPHRWSYNPTTRRFGHTFNIYADTAYYFLTVNPAPGLRVKTAPNISGATQTITTYTERQFHEQDLKKLLPSGREWHGEYFTATLPARTFSFPGLNLVPASPVVVAIAVLASSPTNSQFTLQANSTPIGTQVVNGQGNHDYHAVGETNISYYTFNCPPLASNNSLNINLTYNYGANINATGYLNYLEVTSERYLKFNGIQMNFRSLQNIWPGAVSTFKIENINALTQVWEVTNPLRPQAMPLQTAVSTGLFTIKTDSLREFISFTAADLPKPIFISKIKNQNLHALNTDGRLDFVIITHPGFKVAADRLAEHRRTRDNMAVAVVTINEVYNEFSSGAPDVTAIRDFMRLLYTRSTSAQDGRLYLCLFGDASYDYKSGPGSAKTRTPYNTNFVPIYQSRESLDPLASFSSEDYFGLLDLEEGQWSETHFNSPEGLDIGIGRLPAKTLTEAQNLVNKILRYESPASHGNWRNQITFLADDGDNAEHLQDAESLASYLTDKQPVYNLRKLYLDLFKQTTQPTGQRSSETNQALTQAIEEGTLLLNYTGHGNEISLAHEQILTVPEIKNWQNHDRLAFMLTATCEFGRYDDPKRNSGAEEALLHARGGAIGLLTTTRPVYASHNRVLNRNFFNYAFTSQKGQMPRLGEIYRLTKNKSQDHVNSRNFTLLGDPTLRLAYPELQVAVTHINNIPVKAASPDTLKALAKTTISGIVTQDLTTSLTSFNGEVKITLLGKPSLQKTFGDESNTNGSNAREVKVQEAIIYSGLATVTKGNFTTSFVLPKDISTQVGAGKISLYAFNNTTDAHGAETKIMPGNAPPNITPDTTPPQIKLYLNDETFISGGITGNNPRLLAFLSDTNGINITTHLGHEILAFLDGNKAQPIRLNNYFITEPNNYQAGKLAYLLGNLPPGKHTLTLQAWDTHNNFSEANLEFVVAENNKYTVQNTINYPNPFSSHTTFSFSHNLAGDDLNIQIAIYTASGNLVKNITAERATAITPITDITWTGSDNLNRPLAQGIYFYRVTIHSVQRGISTSSVNKLIILN